MNSRIGYDYITYNKYGIKVPIDMKVGHLICVGGSGSGKTTAVMYWLYKLLKEESDSCIYIMDFKASKDFEGVTDKYAEFEECYKGIEEFYSVFLNTIEGGDGTIRILLIDEIAGLLMHYSMSKEGKGKADKIRMMMSSILMLGRSRGCYLWLVMQRYSATIFPASSGAADNFHSIIGLGRLPPDSKKSLFAGENLEDNSLVFGQGKGIVLIDGQPLQAVIIPRVSKEKMLEKLQEMNSMRNMVDATKDSIRKNR